MGLRAELSADLKRYQSERYVGWRSVARLPSLLAHEPALIAILHYRIGRRGKLNRRPSLRGLHAAAAVPIRLLTGVELPVGTSVGPGFRISHYGNTIINGNARIGSLCTLEQGVLIAGTAAGAPTIGNHVLIGARAVLLGPITIGDRAIVGAGAVVVKDVPAGHVATGNPAQSRVYTAK